MKKRTSIIALALIASLFFNFLPQAALAQNIFNDLRITPIDPRTEDYENLKKISQTYLDQELGRIEEGQTSEKQTNFEVLSIQQDQLGMTHIKFRQTYKDIPVFGSEAIVHLYRDGSLYTVTNDVSVELEEERIDTFPQISADEAAAKAAELARCVSCTISRSSAPELMIYAEKKDLQQESERPVETKPARLAYRVSFDYAGEHNHEGEEPKMPVIFIDAQNGEEVFSYDNLQTQNVTNSGSSLYSGNVTFTAFRFGAPYYLENLNRKIGTFNGTTSVRFSDPDGFWNSSIQRAGVDAHWGAEKTLEYYQNVFGRNGVNGSGGPLSISAVNGSTNLFPSIVHVGTNYNNAFWNGSSVNYGDGDGNVFSPLVSLDVVGHEITHGVTQFSAGLIYSGQSGALNESMSDVFGNMIERYAKGASNNNWLVGEQVYTPNNPNDALRNMANPNAQGQPDHYSQTPFPSNGSCGVHTCSGVPNHAFYLLSQGGTHRLGGGMTGIGADRAAAIWYYALTNYMTSTTNFLGARTATINAANVLYGTADANAVAKAWCLVGVGPCGGITYRAHVANLGWLPWVSNGATAGTTGQSRRMEAAQITVNNLPAGVGVQYRAHVANFGWLPWVANGATAGTTGQSRRMEAIEIKLTNAPPTCEVTYRAHVANLGWLGWVSNGATAGTTGQSRQMEALQAFVSCQ